MFQANQKQNIMQNYTLFFVDLFSICLSYVLAILTRGILVDVKRNTQYYMLILFFAVILCLLSYVLLNWNIQFITRGYLAEFFFVLKYDAALGCGLGLFLFLTQKAQDFSRLAFIYFLIYNFVFTYIFHLLIKHFFTKIYMQSNHSYKMMVITESAYAESLLGKLKSNAEWSHQITALAIMDESVIGESIDHIPIVADKKTLFTHLNELVLDEVFIHLPEYSNKKLGSMIEKFELAGITVHLNIDPFDQIIARKTTDNFAGLTVLTYSISDFDFHRLMLKRCMDVVGSLVGILITLLMFPFIAIAIKTDSKGPIFYSQKRIGLNGREFYLYKFRSMYVDADERKAELEMQNEMKGPMFKITDDPRVTKVGKFLRKTSLDEFPQFFNILGGSMSLVGTRPPTPDEYAQYKLQYRRRLSIKPGLTGLWQVSGRSNITDFNEVVRLDLHYIDHWSLGMDIKIILQTLLVLCNQKGAK
ncbi:MAG: sugar transferase [Lachnospiraceae bacterium]|nr:sugar transferase [Lachnospiraceae bacterium]